MSQSCGPSSPPRPDPPVAEPGVPPLLVICGATASGKTRLALRLAEALAGEGTAAEIVSADSRQVFRGMDIGTAKVSRAERDRVPHHGLDLVDPDALFTAADFQAHAASILPAIAARGAVALLVGGTGLYVRAVARGLRFAPEETDASVRAELDARLADDGLASLAAELQAVAPTIAGSTDLANPRRVVRALERARLVGDRPPGRPRGYPGASRWLGLAITRSESQGRIAERAETQFAAGLVEEATALRARFGVHPRAFSAFGYYEALDLADGRLSRAEAIAGDVRRTNAYARRQLTWFRAEPGIRWLGGGGEDPDPLPAALDEVHAMLERPTTHRSGILARALGR
jgi:tRNA dimethylallyltransferase